MYGKRKEEKGKKESKAEIYYFCVVVIAVTSHLFLSPYFLSSRSIPPNFEKWSPPIRHSLSLLSLRIRIILKCEIMLHRILWAVLFNGKHRRAVIDSDCEYCRSDLHSVPSSQNECFSYSSVISKDIIRSEIQTENREQVWALSQTSLYFHLRFVITLKHSILF